MLYDFAPLVSEDLVFEDENVIIFTPKLLSRCKYYCSLRKGTRCFSENGYAHWRGVHGNTVYFLKHKHHLTTIKGKQYETCYMIDRWNGSVAHPKHKLPWDFSIYLLNYDSGEMSIKKALKIAPFLNEYLQYCVSIEPSSQERKNLILLRNLMMGFFYLKEERLLRFFISLSEEMKNEIFELTKYSKILQKHIPLLYPYLDKTNQEKMLTMGVPLDSNITETFTPEQQEKYKAALDHVPINLIVT